MTIIFKSSEISNLLKVLLVFIVVMTASEYHLLYNSFLTSRNEMTEALFCYREDDDRRIDQIERMCHCDIQEGGTGPFATQSGYFMMVEVVYDEKLGNYLACLAMLNSLFRTLRLQTTAQMVPYRCILKDRYGFYHFLAFQTDSKESAICASLSSKKKSSNRQSATRLSYFSKSGAKLMTDLHPSTSDAALFDAASDVSSKSDHPFLKTSGALPGKAAAEIFKASRRINEPRADTPEILRVARDHASRLRARRLYREKCRAEERKKGSKGSPSTRNRLTTESLAMHSPNGSNVVQRLSDGTTPNKLSTPKPATERHLSANVKPAKGRHLSTSPKPATGRHLSTSPKPATGRHLSLSPKPAASARTSETAGGTRTAHRDAERTKHQSSRPTTGGRGQLSNEATQRKAAGARSSHQAASTQRAKIVVPPPQVAKGRGRPMTPTLPTDPVKNFEMTSSTSTQAGDLQEGVEVSGLSDETSDARTRAAVVNQSVASQSADDFPLSPLPIYNDDSLTFQLSGHDISNQMIDEVCREISCDLLKRLPEFLLACKAALPDVPTRTLLDEMELILAREARRMKQRQMDRTYDVTTAEVSELHTQMGPAIDHDAQVTLAADLDSHKVRQEEKREITK